MLRYEIRRESLRRLRVRTADGRREVALESYAMVRDAGNHEAMIHRLVAEGMSTRGLARACGGALGKSRMAEAWAQKGREHLVELRGRDLKTHSRVVLLMDGVWARQGAVRHRGGVRRCAGSKAGAGLRGGWPDPRKVDMTWMYLCSNH